MATTCSSVRARERRQALRQDRRKGHGGPAQFCNYQRRSQASNSACRPKRLGKLRSELLRLTGGWPKRLGKDLIVPGTGSEGFIRIRSSREFWVWLNEHLEVKWVNGPGMVSRPELYDSLRMHAKAVDRIERFPHYPQMPGHEYASHPKRHANGKALKGLLDMFSPGSPEDADLIKALLLTLLWGGAGGTRPAFLVTGKTQHGDGGHGVGKSSFVEVVSELVGGALETRPGEGIEQIKTRLLSAEGSRLRVVRVDNLHAVGFRWPDIESVVTAPVISGKENYRGEGRRPNTVTWVFTGNGVSVGKDLAQRIVMIQLERPVHVAGWKEKALAYVGKNRDAIFADLAAEFRRRPLIKKGRACRWATWQRKILGRVSNPVGCLDAILKRQAEIDTDDEEAKLVTAQFRAQLQARAHDPETSCVFVSSRLAAEWLKECTGTHRPTSKATSHLAGLGIQELSKSANGGVPGWRWRGLGCSNGVAMCNVETQPIYRNEHSGIRTSAILSERTNAATRAKEFIRIDIQIPI